MIVNFFPNSMQLLMNYEEQMNLLFLLYDNFQNSLVHV